MTASMLLMASFTAVLIACGPGPKPTTTTTTTTTSSTTTTIDPACAGYTPSGIVLSDPSASVGDTITVTGFGAPGSSIQVKMVPVGPGTTTAVLATTTVNPGGAWATPLTIPGTVGLGSWKVTANSVGCTATTSALIAIV